MAPRYRPVFFDERWVLQRYQGWLPVANQPSVRVLKKSYGILKRFLVLSDGASGETVAGLLSACGVFAPSSEVILHDFAADETPVRSIRGSNFQLVGDRDRLLNTATFVMDLSKSPDFLLRDMREPFRRRIRAAATRGVAVTVGQDYDLRLVDDFLTNYNAMARERGLSTIRRTDVETMLRDKMAVMGVASLDGDPRSYAMVYLCGSTAYFLNGVSVGPKDEDAGKCLHYGLMKHLQLRGFDWYDLGGVPAIDERNGIYQFKKGFGGELVRLGAEFAHRPAIVRGAHVAARVVRRLRAGCAA